MRKNNPVICGLCTLERVLLFRKGCVIGDRLPPCEVAYNVVHAGEAHGTLALQS